MIKKTKFLFLFLCVVFTNNYLKSSAYCQTVVEKLGCPECHRFSANEDEKKRKAPDLFFSGDKFQKKWLIEFLQKPEIVRPGGFILDPDFLLGAKLKKHQSVTAKEAIKLADLLIKLTLKESSKGIIDNIPISKGEKAKFKIKFERTYGCTACHQAINLARQPRGGISGPSLINAGSRLQGDWIYDKLKHPRKYEPQGRMPIFKIPEEDFISLTKYLLIQKKENIR
jgi:cbb3-type cytochrome oxidase cytochrome c subunit